MKLKNESKLEDVNRCIFSSDSVASTLTIVSFPTMSGKRNNCAANQNYPASDVNLNQHFLPPLEA